MTSSDAARRPARRSENGLASVLARAVEQFHQLSGNTAEQVSGVRATDQGWSFLVEVLELERIPATTSVMACYRVDADGHGDLLGFERLRRYMRAATDPR